MKYPKFPGLKRVPRGQVCQKGDLLVRLRNLDEGSEPTPDWDRCVPMWQIGKIGTKKTHPWFEVYRPISGRRLPMNAYYSTPLPLP